MYIKMQSRNKIEIKISYPCLLSNFKKKSHGKLNEQFSCVKRKRNKICLSFIKHQKSIFFIFCSKPTFCDDINNTPLAFSTINSRGITILNILMVCE